MKVRKFEKLKFLPTFFRALPSWPDFKGRVYRSVELVREVSNQVRGNKVLEPIMQKFVVWSRIIKINDTVFFNKEYSGEGRRKISSSECSEYRSREQGDVSSNPTGSDIFCMFSSIFKIVRNYSEKLQLLQNNPNESVGISEFIYNNCREIIFHRPFLSWKFRSLTSI